LAMLFEGAGNDGSFDELRACTNDSKDFHLIINMNLKATNFISIGLFCYVYTVSMLYKYCFW
jgi:hypothetical protein